MIQTLALKIALVAAVLVGTGAATWGFADAHYSRQYEALKSSYEQAAKDQQAKVNQTIADNKAAAKAVNDEAQAQIGSMAATIGDLSIRLQHNAGGRTVTVRSAPSCPPVAAVQPERSAAPASSGPPAEAAGPSDHPEAIIDAGILTGVLDVSIDALRAELLWRKWVRETRQTP
jgi:hypothetical protein